MKLSYSQGAVYFLSSGLRLKQITSQKKNIQYDILIRVCLSFLLLLTLSPHAVAVKVINPECSHTVRGHSDIQDTIHTQKNTQT